MHLGRTPGQEAVGTGAELEAETLEAETLPLETGLIGVEEPALDTALETGPTGVEETADEAGDEKGTELAGEETAGLLTAEEAGVEAGVLLPASVTGQTVVEIAMMDVTTAVE